MSFGSNGNSYTVCTQPDVCVCIYTNVSPQCHLVTTVIHVQSVRSQTCVCVCVYIYTCSAQYRDAGVTKEMKRTGTAVNAACHLGTRSTCSSSLRQSVHRLRVRHLIWRWDFYSAENLKRSKVNAMLKYDSNCFRVINYIKRSNTAR